MRTLTLAVAAGALLVATQANAGSFPVNTMTGAETGLVDQAAVQVYVHEGRRYCFSFEGWHGPGWYRCGYAWRRGLGWGGVYGWNSWSYGPYERRHHHGNWQDHHRRGDRMDSGSTTRSRSSVDTRTRSRTTTGSSVEGNTRVRGEGNTRMRSTTGRGGADVKSGGNVKMQNGGSGKPSAGGDAGGGASVGGGGASVGGGASGGGEKRQ